MKKSKTKSGKNETKSKVWKVLANIGLVVLPLLVGGLSSLLTGNQMSSFATFKKPPLSPPGWLFPVVWTILYILMGIASIFFFQKVKKKDDLKRAVALRWIYMIQLVFNFSWTLVFFGLDAFYVAFGVLLALWGMILAMLILSYKKYRLSFWFLLPYFAWISFAGYLNIMIAILN